MWRSAVMKSACIGLMLVAGTLPVLAQDRPVNSNRAMATDNVNVRKGAGPRFPIIDVVHRGEEVAIVQCRGDFCLINHDGPKGWVNRNYLRPLIVR